MYTAGRCKRLEPACFDKIRWATVADIYCQIDCELSTSLLVVLLTHCPPAGTYNFKRRSSIPGNNIDCRYRDYKGNLQPFCRVNGDIRELAASCDANADCAAFDMDGSSTGYLKKVAGSTQYTEGFSVYVKGTGGKPSASSG
jgi:hypothetical protein